MVKKAYIITIEAIIAIVVLYIFMTYALSRNVERPKVSVPKDIALSQDTIFSQIQTNDYYRTCALQENYPCLDNMIGLSVKQGWLYNFTICHTTLCQAFILNENKDVYVKSLILSTNTTYYNTTLVTLYIWRKI